MIWTDLIEEFPEDGYIHPLHEGKGHDGRKYRPVWHAVESTKGMDHKIVTDGGRQASEIGHEDLVVTMEDGMPALKIGDTTVLLRVFVEVADEIAEENNPNGTRHLETREESDSDDGQGWWTVTKDESEPGEWDPYPWVTIQPEVKES